MTETTFGRLSVNDGKLIGRLRSGRSLTLATAEKVREFIKKHTPPANDSGPTHAAGFLA